MSVVYDAGVLIAAERNDRRQWADHRARLELGVLPTTTAPVVAQVSRTPRQVQLRRLLRGCRIEPLRADQAHEIGALLAAAGLADVVDAHVVITAAATAAPICTSDPDDLVRLSEHLPQPVRIRRI